MVQLRGFLASSKDGKEEQHSNTYTCSSESHPFGLERDGVIAKHHYMYLLMPRCLVGASTRLVDVLTFFDWLIFASCGEGAEGVCNYLYHQVIIVESKGSPTNQIYDAQVEVLRGRAARHQVRGKLRDASRGTSVVKLGYGCREFSTNCETYF